jgi:hypothetical protein
MISATVLPVAATMNEKTNIEAKIIENIKRYNTNDFLNQYGKERIPVELDNLNFIPNYNTLAGPNYEFLKEPVTLIVSYYDYQPGSYCGFPIDRQTENGDGVYLTFHEQETPKGERFQFYAYIDGNYNVQCDAIDMSARQGYGTLAVHPATGNAIASWHEDSDGDGLLDVGITYDDFDKAETAGAWKTPKYMEDSTGDEFAWPYIYIGPSPIEGYVRVYNVQSSSAGVPEPYRLSYIDIENTNGMDMSDITKISNWNSVRIFDDWCAKSIRPFASFAVDYTTPGRVTFVGNAAWLDGDLGNMPVEQGAYVWESLDYGETWSYTNLHTDGPESYLYMVDNIIQADFDGTIPDELSVGIAGEHSAPIYDADGNLHYPFIADYGHETEEGRYYLPYYMPQMELVWDGTSFTFNEVSKMPGVDPSGHSVPWTDANNAEPVITWSTYEGDAIFHENCQKQAVNLENGWMAHMWADGTYAQLAADGEPGYEEYLKHPIIYIATSNDNGNTWSEPIKLTDINSELFDFSEQITVYPYLCDTILDIGDDWGQIDMFYFDDNQFGSSVQGGVASDKSGQVTYCSIKIDFSTGAAPTTPTATYDKKSDELTVTSTDPDGDQIRYGVSWDNDQNVDEWTAFVNSGTSATIDCGGREGTVGVIAEDSNGLQSPWTSVTPKNKPMGLQLLLMELFPQIYKLIQNLLQL